MDITTFDADQEWSLVKASLEDETRNILTLIQERAKVGYSSLVLELEKPLSDSMGRILRSKRFIISMEYLGGKYNTTIRW